LYRLAYQISAAACLGWAMRVSWLTSRNTSALALLGLHPVIACSVINGGHNDALVGLALLLAVIAARQERYTRAGGWVAAAVLVKVTAGLALLPIMGWAFFRGGWPAIRKVAVAPMLIAAPIMVLTPGVIGALRQGQVGVISRASIWNVPLRLVSPLLPSPLHPAGTSLGPVSVAFVAVIVVGVSVVHAERRMIDPVTGVAIAVTAWLIFAGYVLPWYTVWALPAAALLGRHRVMWLVAAQGVAVTTAFVIPHAWFASPVAFVPQFGIPIALAVMFIWAVRQPRPIRLGCR
jgi:hypothetical protein